MLMPLDLRLGYLHECPSSRIGESIFRSLSVPKNLCAFDKLLPVVIVGERTGTLLSLLDVCFRPGNGKWNFEVLPILATVPKASGGGSDWQFFTSASPVT